MKQLNAASLYFVISLLLLPFCISSCREASNPEQEDAVKDSTSGVSSTESEMDLANELFGLTEQWTGGLDGMIKRGRIRALVSYNRTSYFINGRKRGGITYEALNLFEKELNQSLGKKPGTPGYIQVIFIPLTRDRILPALAEGYGDIAAANLVITEKLASTMDFSKPLLRDWRELFVSGPAAPEIKQSGDLLGETVYIRRSSSYYEHLQIFNDSLRRVGKPVINMEFVDEHLEDDELLEMVNAGLIPTTICNEFTVNLWEPLLDEIRPHRDVYLKTGGEIVWAFRKNSPKLKNAVDAFTENHKKGTLTGNILLNRYMGNSGYLKKANAPGAQERFLELRELFIKYGEEYDLDWLLLAAQGYQESELDHSKRSPAGAVGIMQIKPSTAADPNVGIDNVYDLENNIHAAAKYMDFLRSR